MVGVGAGVGVISVCVWGGGAIMTPMFVCYYI